MIFIQAVGFGRKILTIPAGCTEPAAVATASGTAWRDEQPKKFSIIFRRTAPASLPAIASNSFIPLKPI